MDTSSMCTCMWYMPVLTAASAKGAVTWLMPEAAMVGISTAWEMAAKSMYPVSDQWVENHPYIR
jgi:hypothetical protein